MASTEKIWAGTSLNESKVPIVIAIPVTFTTLAIIAVALRFWIRWTRRGGLWIDEGLILISMTLSIVASTLLMRQIPRGYGRRLDTPPTKLDVMLSARDMFFAQLIYFAANGFCKMSILFFYLRLVGGASNLRVAVRVTMAVVVTSSLAMILSNVFECWPVSFAWGGVIEGHCFNRWALWAAGAAINVVTDAVVFTLPIPTILRMKLLPTRQKVALVFVFGLGLFTIAAGAVRLGAMVTQLAAKVKIQHPTWNYLLASLSSVAELNTGIIGACLPALKPLLSCLFASNTDPCGKIKRDEQNLEDENQKADDDDKRLSNATVAPADREERNHSLNRHLPFFHRPSDTTVTTIVDQQKGRTLSSEWPTAYGHNDRVSSTHVRVQGNYNRRNASPSPPRSSCSMGGGEGSGGSAPRIGTSSTEVTTPAGRSRSVSGTGSEENHRDSGAISPVFDSRLPRKYSDGTGNGSNVHIVKTTRISVSRSASVSGGGL